MVWLLILKSKVHITQTHQGEHIMNLTELFCNIDDFCVEFEKHWNKKLLESGEKKRNRKRQLSMS